MLTTPVIQAIIHVVPTGLILVVFRLYSSQFSHLHINPLKGMRFGSVKRHNGQVPVIPSTREMDQMSVHLILVQIFPAAECLHRGWIFHHQGRTVAAMIFTDQALHPNTRHHLFMKPRLILFPLIPNTLPNQ